jgi:hypothetical protein
MDMPDLDMEYLFECPWPDGDVAERVCKVGRMVEVDEWLDGVSVLATLKASAINAVGVMTIASREGETRRSENPLWKLLTEAFRVRD